MFFSKKNNKLLLVIIFVTFTFLNCNRKQNSDSGQHFDGPYFGNGILNGWADQTSIVIWTRLTERPEGNKDGEKFLIPSAEEHRQLNMEANPEKIWNAQIPHGLSLNDMEGACPGTSGEVKIVYYPLTQQEKKVITEWVAVSNKKNFTHQWKLENLIPGTKYIVELEARRDSNSKVSDRIEGTFRTPPTVDTIEEIDFCIVTCNEYLKRDSSGGLKIYDVMLNMFPDFYVHTGDIEYYDRPAPYALTEELMRFKWDRFLALPLHRRFWGQVTSYFMKDDHDVLMNDAFPGMTYGTVTWERGLEIFDEQFPASKKPYKTIRWGKDLQIWLTEGRNYRSKNTDPDGPEKTIWGEEQKEWFFKTVNESDATFKILISPNAILGPDKDNKNDNHSNPAWKTEGDEIRNFLNQFDNIFICNGDRHWQYVTHWESTNLWEFGCGASTDEHADGWNPGDVRPEHRFLRVKGGFLRGRVFRENDTSILKFQHFDVDGNVVHEEIFKQ